MGCNDQLQIAIPAHVLATVDQNVLTLLVLRSAASVLMLVGTLGIPHQ